MSKPTAQMIIGILAIVWSFLFSILIFKVFVYLAATCNIMKLTLATIAVSCLLAAFIRNEFNREINNKINDESNDNKKDGV